MEPGALRSYYARTQEAVVTSVQQEAGDRFARSLCQTALSPLCRIPLENVTAAGTLSPSARKGDKVLPGARNLLGTAGSNGFVSAIEPQTAAPDLGPRRLLGRLRAPLEVPLDIGQPGLHLGGELLSQYRQHQPAHQTLGLV